MWRRGGGYAQIMTAELTGSIASPNVTEQLQNARIISSLSDYCFLINHLLFVHSYRYTITKLSLYFIDRLQCLVNLQFS